MKTYSRTSLSIPQSEIRLNPPPWELFSMNHKAMLQCYQLVVTQQLLSHEDPLTIDQLLGMLQYEYYLPSNVVNSFMNFIMNVETKHIEWETKHNDSVRSNYMYARPRRMKPSITGPYSRWIPPREP
jgi:hypothetical protein